MSIYSSDFATLNQILFRRRLNALENIFKYLEVDDFPNLIRYYTLPLVTEILLPPEKAFLDGIARRFYEAYTGKNPTKTKQTH